MAATTFQSPGIPEDAVCCPPPIYNTIAEAVGNTPLVRLHRTPKALGIQCEVLAKCEFMNPGGSVKDRIAREMVDDAIRKGRIASGKHRVVEPTSGNTGIGLAMMSAVRGLDAVIVMPNKMSKEKATALNALGARVVRTPTRCAFDDPDSHISLCNNMVKDDATGHTVMLDQYTNDANPGAHIRGTGAEILKQTEGKVDVIVVGAGTGGTITGISRAIKAANPAVIIVGVDPYGSILAGKGEEDRVGTSYHVEGIGYDFIPGVLDRGVVDHWVKIGDEETFEAARMLQREEGLMVGGSSGSAMAGAVKAAKELGLTADQRMVVVLPDNIRNYMSKFADDEWMSAQKLAVPEWKPRTSAPVGVPPNCDPAL